jgi:hypothetical protein
MTDPAVSFSPTGLQSAVEELAPWTPDALIRVAGMNAAGFVLVAVSWFQVSAQLTVRDQLGWLNLGLLGVGLCGAGNALWLLRGRRTIGIARRVLWPAGPAGPAGTVDAAPPGPTHSGELRWASGTARMHRPGCALLNGRADRRISRPQADRHGLRPCEVCEP